MSPHANFYQNNEEASYIRVGLAATLRLTGLILRSRAATAAFDDVDLFRSSFASFLCCGCGWAPNHKKGMSKDLETIQKLGHIIKT